MNVQLPFGKSRTTLTIPDANFLKTLMPNDIEEGPTGDEEVIRSLNRRTESGDCHQ